MKSITIPIITIAASLGSASASSDYSGFTPDSTPSAPYFYSETINVYDEYDALDYSDSEVEDYSDSLVSSSLLYDGGCLVSSQAMMLNGGDSFMSAFEFESDVDFSDDEEEDDDDDDDDGHSSMLSNASLRRSKALAGGSVQHTPKSYNKPSEPETTTAYFEGEIRYNKSSMPKTSLIFGVRNFSNTKKPLMN